MAELDYALLADYARVEPSGTLTVIGGSWTYVDTATLPAHHRFSVAGRIKSRIDVDPVNFRVEYLGPDDIFRIAAEAELSADANARSYDDGRVGLFFAVDAQLPLPREGLYQVVLSIDGVHARTLKFEVQQTSSR